MPSSRRRFLPSPRGAIAALALLVSVLLPAPAHAWGDKGHQIINRLAAETMPAETPAFFRAAAAQLEYLGPEPDRWRPRPGATDVSFLHAAAAPDHFLDMEFVAGFALPRSRYEYRRALLAHGVVTGDVKLETPGFLPYRITELTQMLRREWALWRAAPTATPEDRARRQQIEQNILSVAGILGHYVGDGSNPHHTTWHYDGWVEAREPNPERFTTAKGIHLRFETEFVDKAVALADVRSLVAAPRPVGDLFDDTVAYLKVSHALVRDLYRLDKRNAFRPAAENAAANAEGKQFACARLAAGAAMLRDLWAAATRP